MPRNISKKYKIAFVLDDGMDAEDGVQQYIWTLSKWLMDQGHSVDYLVGETVRKDIPNLYSIPKNLRVKFNGNKMTIPLYASSIKIKNILLQNQYDILHVQVPYSPLFGAKVVSAAKKHLPGAIIVGTFHIAPYGTLSKNASKVLKLLLNPTLKKFDGFISVSGAAEQFAKEVFNIQSGVLPNVVDVIKFQPKSKIRKNKVLRLVYVGRLVKRKGCIELIEAINIIHSKYPEFQFELIICGKGDLDLLLKQKVSEYNLKSFIYFKGFVSDAEKVNILQTADIAIFPSISGESFGIVLIEAMAAHAGVVLGGDNDGYRTVLDSNPETLLDVLDIEVFSKNLYRFMSDETLRQQIHSRQQKDLEQYGVSTVGPKILKFYENCKSTKNNR